MIVKDVDKCLRNYNELFGTAVRITVTYSDPWNPLRGEDIFYDLNYQHGVYIYSECEDTDWDIKLTENRNKIWYIGKSTGSIRARIWRHIAIDSKKIKEGEPKFKNHRWVNEPGIMGTSICDSIANGDFNVYAIPIGSEEGNHFPPEIVETYLLCCYYKSQGRLPILNRLFSQYKPKR